MSELAERLGVSPTSRLVIISADGLGASHAANEGCYSAVRGGLAESASLLVPGPWTRHAAATYRGESIGVLLTLNAPHDIVRWGPITSAPSLLDGDGGFPRTPSDLWDHADLHEVRRECRAQVERAILAGFGVTYLATLDDALQQRPEFFDVLLDLAIEYRLPVRLGGAEAEDAAGFPFRALAAEEGVVCPDRVVDARGLDRPRFEQLLTELPAGVSNIITEPAIDSKELRAARPDWPERVADHDHLVGDSGLTALLERLQIQRICYKDLVPLTAISTAP